MYADNMPADVDEAEAAPGRGDILYSERKIDEAPASVRRFYYESHDQLRRHLTDFVSAYNYPQTQDPAGIYSLRVHLRGMRYTAQALHKKQLRQIPGLNSSLSPSLCRAVP